MGGRASEERRDRITIAILALGGQGGGVLADWVIELASRNGWIAQGTSVPGVAQRTGSTVYYIEMLRRPALAANAPDPVLALMPVPGDVDIVIASELMEAGRAILRGFSTEDRTTLIGSTHRIYAISEKSVPGDGTASSRRILDAAERRARRFIGFDMDRAATEAGSAISAVMFGALAGSGALPFERSLFEDAIRHGGKAIDANLRGLSLGLDRAAGVRAARDAATAPPQPTTPAGLALWERVRADLPEAAHPFALEGVRRLMDYQDRAYAAEYLDRLAAIHALDDGHDDWRLTRETARRLATWMAYEDIIRVADLKVRAARSTRVRAEAGLVGGQVLRVTEYMHPRLQEICETMPAGLGRALLASPGLRRFLAPLFARGRHVETTRLRWFLALRACAALRPLRPRTLRHAEESARIEAWLAFVREAAIVDTAFAAEAVLVQQLIKGYSDTFERGLARFAAVMAAAKTLLGTAGAAATLAGLREAALADAEGQSFAREMERLGLAA